MNLKIALTELHYLEFWNGKFPHRWKSNHVAFQGFIRLLWGFLTRSWHQPILRHALNDDQYKNCEEKATELKAFSTQTLRNGSCFEIILRMYYWYRGLSHPSTNVRKVLVVSRWTVVDHSLLSISIRKFSAILQFSRYISVKVSNYSIFGKLTQHHFRYCSASCRNT